jgi:hypothetical protein
MTYIKEAIRYWLEPKPYALHLGCRECSQRVDTKPVTREENFALLKAWNQYHNHLNAKGQAK